MTKFLLSDLDGVSKNGLKVFTTFSCGGGSSIGYKLSGYDVIAANDIDPEMKWHYEKNLHPKYYYLCPIKDLITADLPKEIFDIAFWMDHHHALRLALQETGKRIGAKISTLGKGKPNKFFLICFLNSLNLPAE